jgi:hypothetical protein
MPALEKRWDSRHCVRAPISPAMLALEKFAVIVGGAGLGWGLWAASWLVRSLPTNSYSARVYRNVRRDAPRDTRLGLIVALLGFAVAGAVWLIRGA